MSERSISHGSFAVERVYPAPPKRVFEALTTLEAKSRWFAGPEDHEVVIALEMDIRVSTEPGTSWMPWAESWTR